MAAYWGSRWPYRSSRDRARFRPPSCTRVLTLYIWADRATPSMTRSRRTALARCRPLPRVCPLPPACCEDHLFLRRVSSGARRAPCGNRSSKKLDQKYRTVRSLRSLSSGEPRLRRGCSRPAGTPAFPRVARPAHSRRHAFPATAPHRSAPAPLRPRTAPPPHRSAPAPLRPRTAPPPHRPAYANSSRALSSASTSLSTSSRVL